MTYSYVKYKNIFHLFPGNALTRIPQRGKRVDESEKVVQIWSAAVIEHSCFPRLVHGAWREIRPPRRNGASGAEARYQDLLRQRHPTEIAPTVRRGNRRGIRQVPCGTPCNRGIYSGKATTTFL